MTFGYFIDYKSSHVLQLTRQNNSKIKCLIKKLIKGRTVEVGYPPGSIPLEIPLKVPFTLYQDDRGVKIRKRQEFVAIFKLKDWEILQNDLLLLNNTLIYCKGHLYIFKDDLPIKLSYILTAIQEHSCPISLDNLKVYRITTRLKRPLRYEQSSEFDGRPWFHTSCGHVYDFYESLLGMTECPLCRRIGSFKPLLLSPAIQSIPTSVVVPCGHMLDIKEFKLFTSTPDLYYQETFIGGFDKCPFCHQSTDNILQLFYS